MTMNIRAVLSGLSALVTGGAMIAARVLARPTPGVDDPAAVEVWYQRHGSVLGWRALALGVAAVALVAFAASFREYTWSTVPTRLWTGTLMVLAALGYAGLSSTAAAVDVAVLWRISPTEVPSLELIGLAGSVERAMLVLATPALLVVLLAASVPLVRWGRIGRTIATAAVLVSIALATPLSWERGLDVVPAWFLIVGIFLLAARRGADATADALLPTDRRSVIVPDDD